MAIRMLHRCILIFALLVSNVSYTQTYSFVNYSIQDGLAQSQATDIVQDEQGYLWISSLGGLSRFDGLNFNNFSKENGLVDNHIHQLFYNDSKLYVGANGGISIIENYQIKSLRLPKNISEAKIRSFTQDSSGRIWVGSDIAGLWCLNNDSLVHKSELPFVDIKALYAEENFLWVGSSKGLFKYFPDKDNWTIPFNELNEEGIQDIQIGMDNSIWIATYNGLFAYTNGELKRFGVENGLISNRIKNIHLDRQGNIWIASKNGISKISRDGIMNFSSANGLVNQDIKAIYSDSEGNLWLASNGNGIFRFSGEQIFTFTGDDKLCSGQALSIMEGPSNEMWIGSFQNGVCKIIGDEILHYDENNGLSDNTVWAGLIDKDENVWFGTSSDLNKISGKELTQYREESESAGGNRITSLFQDSKERIWIGHKFGVRVFENNSFKSYSSSNGLQGRRIRSIREDNEGAIWLGAENGLFKYSSSSFTKITQGDHFDDNSVLNISIGKDENIWLGTKDGLFLYKNGSFTRVFLDEIFSSNYINFTLFYQHHLLVGTNNGLYIVDSNKYLKNDPNYIRHFGLEDGLPSLECNLNAVTIDSKNKLWFGTGKGLVIADVDYLVSSDLTPPPVVHIDNVRIFMDENINRGGGIKAFGERVFNPNENHITFDITGISLKSPQSLQFEYRLKGLQDKFLPLINSSFVSFPYLPHGSYEFEIYALSKSGERSLKPATYSFEIEAPYYRQTWFFVLLLILVVIIGIIALQSSRRIQLRKIESQRLVYQSRILSLEQQSLNSSMNRHFIFNALNSIQYYINRQDKLSANKYLSNFAKLIRKNLDSSQENLSYLSSELERIDLYLSLEHMRFQDKFEYEISVSDKVDPNTVKIPSMLLQPFLENSIWHGILPKEEKGKIQLNIDRSLSGAIKITIDDNGIGVKQSLANKNGKDRIHDSKGVSLTNDRIVLYQKLTHENFKINGPYELKDKDKAVIGTRVDIYLPESQAFEEIISETNKLGKLALNN